MSTIAHTWRYVFDTRIVAHVNYHWVGLICFCWGVLFVVMQVLLLLLQQLLFVVCVVSERELTVNETTWIAGSVSNNVIETVSFNIEEEHIDKVSYITFD